MKIKMKSMIITAMVIVVMAMLPAVACAATYYVATTGSDANSGAEEAPWRTIQHAADTMIAGDTVIVLSGEYNEIVTTKRHGIGEEERITFLASPENGPVTLKGFDVDHRYITIQGFTFRKRIHRAMLSLWRNPDGDPDDIDCSYCNIINNTFTDGVYLISGKYHFDHTTNSITSADPEKNFKDVGFVSGAIVYLGANAAYPYNNHDREQTIETISEDGYTMYFRLDYVDISSFSRENWRRDILDYNALFAKLIEKGYIEPDGKVSSYFNYLDDEFALWLITSQNLNVDYDEYQNWIDEGAELVISDPEDAEVLKDDLYRVRKVLRAHQNLIAEEDNEIYAVLYAGGKNGISAIAMGVGTVGDAAKGITGCVIRKNTFRDLFGLVFEINGNNCVIEENLYEANNGWQFNIFGINQTFRRNILRDNEHFLLLTEEEVRDVDHESGEYWDFYAGLVHSHGKDDHNIVIEENYFENCYNQIGYFSREENSSDVFIRNNVLVGFPVHMSCNRPGLVFENNTLYKTPYQSGHAVATGPREEFEGEPFDITIRKNAFVEGGYRDREEMSVDNTGWYSFTEHVTSVDADYNFIAGPETLGYPSRAGFDQMKIDNEAKFPGIEANAINGGDPLFVNPHDPDGEDDIPFTADDGLRPLPNSPLILNGYVKDPNNPNFPLIKDGEEYIIGVYEPVTCTDGKPFAHFLVESPRWWLLKHELGDYKSPDVLGYTPVTAVFDATNSVSGVTDDSKDNVGIIEYSWNFGDGSPVFVSTEEPKAEHEFTESGEYTVTLTVTNTLGNSASYERVYEVLEMDADKVLHISFDDEKVEDGTGRGHQVFWSDEELAAYDVNTQFGAGAASFSALNGSMVVVDNRDDLQGMDNLTVAFWAQKSSEEMDEEVIMMHATYHMNVTATGFSVSLWTIEQPRITISTNEGTNDTAWHHYAVTYDGSKAKIYIDGDMKAEEVLSGRIVSKDNQICIGNSFTPEFSGLIDELWIYNKALSDVELDSLIQTNRLPDEVLCGDVNNDGEVTIYDAALCVQAALGLITLTLEQTEAADVDGNGEVTIYDAALIVKYALGLITEF